MKYHAKWMVGAASALSAYFLAIKPGTRHRADRMNGIFYAHRGLHSREAGIPENSMAAFLQAVEAGYGIELDVQLTKDQKAVVFHDFTLQRVCGTEGKVSDFTYSELQKFTLHETQERIPLLSDVLTLVNGKIPLLIEIKCPDWKTHVCEKVDEVLTEYRGEYTIESFNPFALLWYRRHRPKICRGQLAMNFQRQEGNYGPECFVARHLLTNFLTKPDFIAYDIRDKEAVSKNLCRKLFGCPSAAWTVRSKEQLKKIRPYYDSFIFEGFYPPRCKES